MKYRIDSFHDRKHTTNYFENLEAAESFGETESSKLRIVFLLEQISSGRYDVVRQIQK